MTNRHGGPNAERATRAEVGGEGKFVVASAVVCFSLLRCSIVTLSTC
jgi:hypothetical protein